MSEPAPLPWRLAAASVHREPRTYRYEADPSQLAALAGALEIHQVDRLVVSGSAVRLSTHRIEVSLSLTVELQQLSVVSLEPVAESHEVTEQQVYDETLQAQLPNETELDDTDLDTEDLPLVDGHVPLGELVQELLALALQPYPKAEGEAWQDHIEDDGSKDEQTPSPFAALSQLKTKG